MYNASILMQGQFCSLCWERCAQRQAGGSCLNGLTFAVYPNASQLRYLTLTTKNGAPFSTLNLHNRFPPFTARQQKPAASIPQAISQPPESATLADPALSFEEFNQLIESWSAEQPCTQQTGNAALATEIATDIAYRYQHAQNTGANVVENSDKNREIHTVQDTGAIARVAPLARREYLHIIETLPDRFGPADQPEQQYPNADQYQFNKQYMTRWLLALQQQDALFKESAWALPTNQEELYKFGKMLRKPPYFKLYDNKERRNIFWAVKRAAFPTVINYCSFQYAESEKEEVLAYVRAHNNRLQKAAKVYFVGKTSIQRWRDERVGKIRQTMPQPPEPERTNF